MPLNADSSAFPVFQGEGRFVTQGLSARVYLAGRAMQGIISNPSLLSDLTHAQDVATQALSHADALILALNHTT